MNRRDLLTRGPLALLGIGAIAAGVKAAPLEETRTIVVEIRPAAKDSHIIKLIKDAPSSGAWGPLDRKYLTTRRRPNA